MQMIVLTEITAHLLGMPKTLHNLPKNFRAAPFAP